MTLCVRTTTPLKLPKAWEIIASASPVSTKTRNDGGGVARFGDEVTLKRFVRLDKRHVELRPDSHNPAHETIAIDLAKHIVQLGSAVN